MKDIDRWLLTSLEIDSQTFDSRGCVTLPHNRAEMGRLLWEAHLMPSAEATILLQFHRIQGRWLWRMTC